MSRRKFTSKFKAKVVLESLKETQTMAELAQKYQLHPQQISNWKREFLDNAEKVFTGDKVSKKTEAERKEETLLKCIYR